MLKKLVIAIRATLAAIPAWLRIQTRKIKGGQLVTRKLYQGHYDSTVYYAKKAQERIHPNCRCSFIPIDNKGVNEQ